MSNDYTYHTGLEWEAEIEPIFTLTPFKYRLSSHISYVTNQSPVFKCHYDQFLDIYFFAFSCFVPLFPRIYH